jgi:peptidoglycan hydrolase-like protein with peptidoglycan-binding domain
MRGIRFAHAARTAAVLLVAPALTLATDGDADAHAAPDRAADQILLPSASWHGRPIKAPHRHDTVRTSAVDRPLDGWSAGPVGYGTGFHRPGGSDRVREVQRRLARLGYRVGPIDGHFGRLTRASVAWFQVKHGLPSTGRATLATVRHLRTRTEPPAATADRRSRPGEPAAAREPAWEAFRQLIGPRVPVPDGRAAQTTTWPVAMWLLIALVALDAVLLLGLYVQRRSGTVTTIALGPPEPLPAEQDPRPTRRFAPPVAAPRVRPPGDIPAGTREGGHE